MPRDPGIIWREILQLKADVARIAIEITNGAVDRASTTQQLARIFNDIERIEESMKTFVTIDRHKISESLIFGLAALILIAFVTALVALTMRTRLP